MRSRVGLWPAGLPTLAQQEIEEEYVKISTAISRSFHFCVHELCSGKPLLIPRLFLLRLQQERLHLRRAVSQEQGRRARQIR